MRLALVAGTDPLETLRAGGRARFADLLEEAAQPRLGETTITQRALLREFERLSQPAQTLIMQLVGGPVAEGEAFARRTWTARAVADTEAKGSGQICLVS